MEGDSSIVGSTDHRVSESPVTARNLCHNSPRSNDSVNPVPTRGPLARIPPPKFAAATGAARRREKERVGLAALVTRQQASPWEADASRAPSFLGEKRRGKEGLTAMMSRSHQGRMSLPRKMEPTESMSLPTCPSMPRLSLFFLTLFGGFPRGGLIRGRAVGVLYGVFGVPLEEWMDWIGVGPRGTEGSLGC